MLRDAKIGTRDLRKMFYIVGNFMIIVYLYGVIKSDTKVNVYNNNMSKLTIIVGVCFISIRAVWQLRQFACMRVHLQMLSSIIKDMVYFVTILILIILVFTLL